MKQQTNINFAPLLIGIIVIIAMLLSSCSRYSGEGCQGNKKMLTAGAGYTKFRK